MPLLGLDVTNLTYVRYLVVAREAAPGRALTLGIGGRLSSPVAPL